MIAREALKGQAGRVAEAARQLAENGVPTLLVLPNSKKPIAHPDTGSWWTLDDPDTVADQVAGAVALGLSKLNLAILLGEEKRSPLVAIDIDGPGGLVQVKALGVSSRDACWVASTPHGWHLVYYSPDGPLPQRVVRAKGLPLDLLVNGYCLVEPSQVGGRPYRFWPGHGPGDIPVAELQQLPDAVVTWWRSVAQPAAPRPAPATAPVDTGGPVLEGSRNAHLTRVAGALRRQGCETGVILDALQAENDTRCRPPLPDREVQAIAKSIAHYPPASSPGPRSSRLTWPGAGAIRPLAELTEGGA
ncbi:MAG: primase C-terminal domain-containing protein [Chloroflexi bacterium]|nr:primase C-terminal domain-containing protein [Chloroflexota bacterium]